MVEVSLCDSQSKLRGGNSATIWLFLESAPWDPELTCKKFSYAKGTILEKPNAKTIRK